MENIRSCTSHLIRNAPSASWLRRDLLLWLGLLLLAHLIQPSTFAWAGDTTVVGGRALVLSPDDLANVDDDGKMDVFIQELATNSYSQLSLPIFDAEFMPYDRVEGDVVPLSTAHWSPSISADGRVALWKRQYELENGGLFSDGVVYNFDTGTASLMPCGGRCIISGDGRIAVERGSYFDTTSGMLVDHPGLPPTHTILDVSFDGSIHLGRDVNGRLLAVQTFTRAATYLDDPTQAYAAGGAGSKAVLAPDGLTAYFVDPQHNLFAANTLTGARHFLLAANSVFVHDASESWLAAQVDNINYVVNPATLNAIELSPPTVPPCAQRGQPFGCVHPPHIHELSAGAAEIVWYASEEERLLMSLAGPTVPTVGSVVPNRDIGDPYVTAGVEAVFLVPQSDPTVNEYCVPQGDCLTVRRLPEYPTQVSQLNFLLPKLLPVLRSPVDPYSWTECSWVHRSGAIATNQVRVFVRDSGTLAFPPDRSVAGGRESFYSTIDVMIREWDTRTRVIPNPLTFARTLDNFQRDRSDPSSAGYDVLMQYTDAGLPSSARAVVQWRRTNDTGYALPGHGNGGRCGVQGQSNYHLDGAIVRIGPRTDFFAEPENARRHVWEACRSGSSTSSYPCSRRIDFGSIVAHELGHVLGLHHPGLVGGGANAAMCDQPIVQATMCPGQGIDFSSSRRTLDRYDENTLIANHTRNGRW
jgi:hypothetical protein